MYNYILNPKNLLDLAPQHHGVCNNKLTYKFDELLQKLNPDNYNAIFYKNRDHYLNETNPLGIRNKIKQFIKLI